MIYIKKLKIVSKYRIKLDISSMGENKSIVYAKVGDTLTPETIIAKVYRSAVSIRITLQDELDIHKGAGDIMGHVDVADGQAVAKGKTLAHKTSIGMENLIRAPFDGIINLDITDECACIILNSIPVEVDVKSLVYGKVVELTQDCIVVESNVLRLFPSCIFGASVDGELMVVQSIDDLGAEAKGRIVYYPGQLTKEFVKKAVALSAMGVIGISADFEMLAVSHANFGIAILEGFGSISLPVYDKIKQSHGQIAFIDVESNEVVIATTLSIEDLKDIYLKDIVLNDSLQIYDPVYFACIGKVQKIDDGKVSVLLPEGNTVSVDEANIIGIL